MTAAHSERLVLLVQSALNLDERPEPTASLRSLGLDSLAMLHLTESIESEFGVRFEVEEILPSHLDSLAGLGNYLDGKLNPGT